MGIFKKKLYWEIDYIKIGGKSGIYFIGLEWINCPTLILQEISVCFAEQFEVIKGELYQK